jgi:hypothetical protein
MRSKVQVLAKTLGHAIEVAALTPHSTWKRLLVEGESIGDSVGYGDEQSFGVYELLAVQELVDSRGASIEIRALATSEGLQLTAYFYSLPEGAEAAQ